MRKRTFAICHLVGIILSEISRERKMLYNITNM